MFNEMVGYIKELTHHLPLVTLVSSFLTFVVGLYVGHRTALWRDRRKEYNQEVEPLLAFFEKVADEIKMSQSYSSAVIPIDSIPRIKRRMSKRKAAKFDKKFEQFMLYRREPSASQGAELLALAESLAVMTALK